MDEAVDVASSRRGVEVEGEEERGRRTARK